MSRHALAASLLIALVLATSPASATIPDPLEPPRPLLEEAFLADLEATLELAVAADHLAEAEPRGPPIHLVAPASWPFGGPAHPCRPVRSWRSTCVLGYPVPSLLEPLQIALPEPDLALELDLRGPENRVRGSNLGLSAYPSGNTWFSGGIASGLGEARFYDTELGLFLSEDPAPDNYSNPPSLHKYLYAFQNPTVWVDPDGRTEFLRDAIQWVSEQKEKYRDYQFDEDDEVRISAAVGYGFAGAGEVILEGFNFLTNVAAKAVPDSKVGREAEAELDALADEIVAGVSDLAQDVLENPFEVGVRLAEARNEVVVSGLGLVLKASLGDEEAQFTLVSGATELGVLTLLSEGLAAELGSLRATGTAVRRGPGGDVPELSTWRVLIDEEPVPSGRSSGGTASVDPSVRPGRAPVPEGAGPYREVRGHHVHAKAAFREHATYNPRQGFSVSQEFMESRDWSHADMTKAQRRLFRELEESGRPNTLAEHTRIAVEALKAGGAPETEARALVAHSLRDLRAQDVRSPTRIPWQRGD